MIIGITGTLGAGKGTVSEYLVQKKGFEHFAVSDTVLVGEARKRGLEPNRDTRRAIANEYRALGPTKLVEAGYMIAEPAIAAGKDVIIDPLHTAAEVEFIQSKGGIVVGVDADLRVRYERIAKRGGSKDHVSFEEFSAQQALEMASEDPNKNNLAAALHGADVQLTNNGTPEELYAQIERALS